MHNTKVLTLKTQVIEYLHNLLKETVFAGDEMAVLCLVQALEETASSLREYRETMRVDPIYRCNDCDKEWTTKMTVKEERERRPDNCPACYNKSMVRAKASSRSVFTDCFHYIES